MKRAPTIAELRQRATGMKPPVAQHLREAERTTPMPTALWGLSESEQLHLALPVLKLARAAVVAGAEPLDSIAQAGMSRIECEYARRALRVVLFEWNLLAWQNNRATRQSDKTRAFDRAIRLCRRVNGRKGGWRVSAGIEAKHRSAVGAP